MSKTAIAPIVALILMVVGGLFHIDFTEDEKTIITESAALLITAGITLYGIIKNHNKPKV